jgi:hypothetical protein
MEVIAWRIYEEPTLQRNEKTTQGLWILIARLPRTEMRRSSEESKKNRSGNDQQ